MNRVIEKIMASDMPTIEKAWDIHMHYHSRLGLEMDVFTAKENLGKISIIAECIERRELHLFLEDMEDVISQLLEANGSIVNEKGILVPIYDKKGEK
jgi:hypothetical protein